MTDPVTVPSHRPRLAREAALLALIAVGLAVLMNLPVALRLGTHLQTEAGEPGARDPHLTAWVIAWEGHALKTNPMRLFQANTYWPSEDSLAFSDALIGYAPAGAVGEGPTAAIIRHNMLFLFAYALAFAGAYSLARVLGVSGPAAAVAGAIYAFAPWRLSQNIHLHVLSSGGIPLAIALLLWGYRRRKPLTIMAGWLVATWQVSLGLNVGLPFGYLLATLGAVALIVWIRDGRPALGRGVLFATVSGLTVLGAWTTLVQVPPYLRVSDAFPQVTTLAEVLRFSPPPRGLLVAPTQSWLWGGATDRIARSLGARPEQALFPGLTALVLAGLGLWTTTFSRARRFGLAVAVGGTALLSLGLAVPRLARIPYRVLYEAAPGWSVIRTPGRLTQFMLLPLALLAAVGAHAMAAWMRRSGRRRGWVAAVALLLVALVLIEGIGPPPTREVLARPAGQSGLADPQLHLPADSFSKDATYMFWSTDGFPKLVNGYGRVLPPLQLSLPERLAEFPDAASLEYLRSLGVRVVILHEDLAAGTTWERAGARPVDGLPVDVRRVGSVVVYLLRSS